MKNRTSLWKIDVPLLLRVGSEKRKSPQYHTHIQPSRGKVSVDFAELWEYRSLLYFLIWRDLKVRYKQTVMGASWAILQPFLTMVIFSLFFGRLAEIPSDDIPYPIFSFSALVPWTFFATGLLQASMSLVTNSNMVKKIYFPRLLMPTAAVLAGLVDFLLAFSVLCVMVWVYDISLTTRVVLLPFFMLVALITSLGVGYWFAAMNVQFRDVRYIVPFVIQAWLFLTPIAYPSSLLSEPWRTVYAINPMAGVIEGFRWALVGSGSPPGLMLAVSTMVSLVVFAGGVYYFRKMEKYFADVI
jgi:lipopolysaccharide transport system permease protein